VFRQLPSAICQRAITFDAVIERESKRELMPMRWGLVPWWWKKKAKEAPATSNARAETVAEKPMFREAFSPGA
jgi:putative SOS response-associated peptidase YedK